MTAVSILATELKVRNRIRVLNDNFRTTFIGGQVVMTAGVAELSMDMKARILLRVQTFSAFSVKNDPYGEHGFGSFTHRGQKYFWKIDYFDSRDPDLGAEDPADSAKTERVLTIMLAEEY